MDTCLVPVLSKLNDIPRNRFNKRRKQSWPYWNPKRLFTKSARNHKPKHSHHRHQARKRALSPSLLVALVALLLWLLWLLRLFWLLFLFGLGLLLRLLAKEPQAPVQATSGYKSWSHVCPVLLSSLLMGKR